MIKDPAGLQRQISAAITRVEGAPVALYRKAVWQIFERIVLETPQFSGRAVANWNLSIGAPDMSHDDSLGDEQQLTKGGWLSKAGAHSRGDMKWAGEALERAKRVVGRIKANDKVWITNAVQGDDDGGNADESYLAALQDPGYWGKKLRAANKPYETALESAIFIAEFYAAAGADSPVTF